MYLMSIVSRILRSFGLRQETGTNIYALDETLHTQLLNLASQENRSPDDVAADLLTAGLTQQHKRDETWGKWQSLSPREQQVAALACLGYTNSEIAYRLHVSPSTVKVYLHGSLYKFNLRNKSDLRLVLEYWDFSAWDSPQH
jgi:DNA-binding NarL/FixJ family response regulator